MTHPSGTGSGTLRPARDAEQPWRGHLRRIGFIDGPGGGQMVTQFFGTQVFADPLPEGGFELSRQRHDPRTLLLPGGPRLPGDLDELQIREEVWNQVRRTLPTGQLADLAAVLRPDLVTATRRALSAMTEGSYRRFIDFKTLSIHGPQYRYGTGVSAERTAAEITAEHTRDPDVVTQLAAEHPDPEIRALAVGNRACPPTVLLRCAENEVTGMVRRALLAQSSRATGLITVLTRNVLTRGPLDHNMTLRLLLHHECGEEYQAALMGHVLSAGPCFRLLAAREATSALPHRRDLVHERLLLGARRVPHTLTMIHTILGDEDLDNHQRVRWMTQHPHPKIRTLFDYYLLKKLVANQTCSRPNQEHFEAQVTDEAWRIGTGAPRTA